MNYVRSALSFIALLLIYEAVALSAVTWSFMESVKSSFVMIEYSATVNAGNILKSLSSISEPMVLKKKMQGMESPVRHFIKGSLTHLDKLVIREVFILSDKGVLLLHSDPSRKKEEGKKAKDFNKAIYTRAGSLSKFKTTEPMQIESRMPADRLDTLLFQLIPGLKTRTMMISAPVYRPEKLESQGSIHLVYELENYGFFIERQKKLYLWLLKDFALIAFGAGLISFLIVSSGKSAVKTTSQEIPPLFEKVTRVETEPETEKTPEDLLPESPVEKVEPVVPSRNIAGIPVKKEIQDAIYLG